MLFADVAESEPDVADEVPSEVAAMDGVESEDEAHNMERPARQQLKKKKPAGKPLSELEVGSTVTGTIKSIAAYGAFVDIGATTDGLLHISQLSTEFVGDVNEVVKEGQEVEVRIVNIDEGKGQVGLSLITAEEAAASQEAAQQARQKRSNRKQNSNDSVIQNALKQKGWDSSAMVEGTVVSTVDFGCFVRVDASKLNSEVEGEFDGLVHISALKSGRVGSVTDVVKVDDKVQVRVKSIDGNKVSLTMLSEEDEATKVEAAVERGMDSGPPEGAANWRELLKEIDAVQPSFQNRAVVEDRRN
jgi:predicted RNA-binding protein with RPS1 domain